MDQTNLEDLDPASDLDELAARTLRAAFRTSPAVVLSVGFHAAILALLPLIIFEEKLRELAGLPITIGVSAVRIDPERPYRPIQSGPPSLDGHGDEEPLSFPDALDASRNESKSADREEIDGRARALAGYLNADAVAGGFQGRMASGPPGTNGIMGIGGGSGTGGVPFVAGLGTGAGRMNLVSRGGGSAATEEAVELGLSWLARHQCSDGAWRPKTGCAKCPQEEQASAEVAATALAAVAFMTAGYGPESHAAVIDLVTKRRLVYGDTVRAALRFLAQRAKVDHVLATGEPNDAGGLAYQWQTYEHAFATMALCEGWRRGGRDLEGPARTALSHLLLRQNSGKAWQYGSQDGYSDISVTAACVQALRSAKLAGLEVREGSAKGIRVFLESVADKEGKTNYMPGVSNCGLPAHAVSSCSALGLYVKSFLEPAPRTTIDETVPKTCKVAADRVGNAQTRRDTYLWYYSMLSLFEWEGPRGADFKSVNEAVTTALVKSQRRKGCACGSWDPDGDAWLQPYGRPLVTALSVLTLEVYYRYVGSDELKTIERR